MRRSIAFCTSVAFLCFSGAQPEPTACGANDGLAISGSTIFGTNWFGGIKIPVDDIRGGGIIYSIETDGSGFQHLHEFAGRPDDGLHPRAGLALSGSTLFGTTREGKGAGTIFSVQTDGSDYALLHTFAGGGIDGISPLTVTLSDSTLFGMTDFGGEFFKGTIYSLETDGTGYQLLHDFEGGANDGSYPQRGSLTVGGSAIYGATHQGGDHDRGTVFALNIDVTGFKLLHEFAGGTSDGEYPLAGLTLSGSALYGTTHSGGDRGAGTIFSINTDGTDFKLLHEFAFHDGHNPVADLTLNGATLYGTTSQGGGGRGTVFSINTDGTDFTLLHEFAGGVDDGWGPGAGLTLAGSSLYGTTAYGGDYDAGVIFSMNTDGAGYTVLHDFVGIPEPSTLVLMLTGVSALGIGWLRRHALRF